MRLFKKYELTGTCKRDFNTEIRYYIASGKIDGAELVALTVSVRESSNENSRILFCVSKVLASMMKKGDIQFYISSDTLSSGNTEAIFIQNKYSQYLLEEKDKYIFYVKMN